MDDLSESAPNKIKEPVAISIPKTEKQEALARKSRLEEQIKVAPKKIQKTDNSENQKYVEEMFPGFTLDLGPTAFDSTDENYLDKISQTNQRYEKASKRAFTRKKFSVAPDNTDANYLNRTILHAKAMSKSKKNY